MSVSSPGTTTKPIPDLVTSITPLYSSNCRCLFLPGFFSFFLPILRWLFKVFNELNYFIIKLVFLVKQEFMFDRNNIKRHAIDLLLKLKQTHRILFRCEQNLFVGL